MGVVSMRMCSTDEERICFRRKTCKVESHRVTSDRRAVLRKKSAMPYTDSKWIYPVRGSVIWLDFGEDANRSPRSVNGR